MSEIDSIQKNPTCFPGYLRSDSCGRFTGEIAKSFLSYCRVEEPTFEAFGAVWDKYVAWAVYDSSDTERRGTWVNDEIHWICGSFVDLLSQTLRSTRDMVSTFFTSADFYLLSRCLSALEAEVDGTYSVLHNGPVRAFGVWGENWHRVAQILGKRFFSAFEKAAGIQPSIVNRPSAAHWMKLSCTEFNSALRRAAKGGDKLGYATLTSKGLDRLNAHLAHEAARVPPIEEPSLYDEDGNCLVAYSIPEFSYTPPAKSANKLVGTGSRLAFHLSSDASSDYVVLDGKIHVVTPEAMRFLEALWKAKGDWVSSKDADVNKVDRLKKKLPAELQAIIESRPRFGSRLNIFA